MRFDLFSKKKMTIEQATFGAGCFWGTEKWFNKTFGNKLKSTAVGFMGGNKEHPSYHQVCGGDTDHAEVIHIEFDNTVLKYEDLLDLFWRFHDPTTKNRQGGDAGTQYRSVIFFHSAEQEKAAHETKAKYQPKWKNPITTEISPAGKFWPAEEYHQKYLDKNPGGYECPAHRLYF